MMNTKQKSILIIGAGVEQVPLIKAAIKMGLFVIGVDKNSGALGFKFCDHKEIIDIVDRQKCMLLAQHYHIDGIITSTEKGLETTAYIADKLNLIGNKYTLVKKIKNKFYQYEVFRNIDIDVPKTYKIYTNTPIPKISFPVIIKPPDAAAARGVFLIKSVSEFKKKFNESFKFTTKNYLLLQEYIKGKEVGAEIVVQNSQVKGIYLTNKISSSPPSFVVLGHLMPALLKKVFKEKIYNVIYQVIKLLEIKNSMINFDFKINKENVYLLEIGLRLGGNWLPYLVQLAGGGNNYQNAIKISLGIPVRNRPCNKYAAIRYTGSGKIITIADRLGYFLVSANTRKELINKVKKNEIQKESNTTF